MAGLGNYNTGSYSQIRIIQQHLKQLRMLFSLSIYKQMILPLFDYSGFLLLSCNKTDREDLQTIQNNAIRLSDRIFLVNIYDRSNLVSLEQRRCIQILLLLFNHGKLHPNVYNVPPRNTRAANGLRFKTEKYENGKYKNSPYYKAAKLWDTLPNNIVDIETMTELKKHLKMYFSPFDEKYFIT